MLDIKFVRENPDIVKENIKKKFQDHKIPMVDEVIKLDEEARKVQQEADSLRADRNKLSKQIGALMGQGKKEEAEEKAMAYLKKVGMDAYINAKPRQLSGGQKQRVAIARALAMEPEILLFDEPTSALDPQMVGEVLNIMRQLAQEGLTMIVVTHEMGFARNVSSKTVFMENGVVVEQAPSREFFEEPKEERTREFLRKIEHTN